VILFMAYDKLVERRQQLILEYAENSESIVKSLFPSDVRRRLMQSKAREEKHVRELEGNLFRYFTNRNRRTPRVLSSGDSPCSNMLISQHDAPIAELFTNTTVMFGDIAGFTAWSSEREPAQVFQLLETAYHAFDVVAKRLGIFKVETIGDCCKCI
jgi:Adenylate and Guanylate cyclase catalytic domain